MRSQARDATNCMKDFQDHKHARLMAPRQRARHWRGTLKLVSCVRPQVASQRQLFGTKSPGDQNRGRSSFLTCISVGGCRSSSRSQLRGRSRRSQPRLRVVGRPYASSPKRPSSFPLYEPCWRLDLRREKIIRA
jgi:hypothetical protein